MDITSQLTVCANYILSNETYYIPDSVALYEANATAAYNALANIWPSSCNESLWRFACQAVFQPRLCQNNNNTTSNSVNNTDNTTNTNININTNGITLTTTYYCSSDCLSTLQVQCLDNNVPNLCQRSSCTTVSNLISQCSTVTDVSALSSLPLQPAVNPINGTQPAVIIKPTNGTNPQQPQQPNLPQSPQPAPVGTYQNPETNNWNASLTSSGNNVKMISWFIGLVLITVNWLQ